MKKTIASILILTLLAVTSTSLEASVRTRSSVGVQFGRTSARPAPRIVRRTPVYVVPRTVPVVVSREPIYQEAVIVEEIPCYYEETVVYPVRCRKPFFSGFSFGLSFFN